MAHVRKTAAGTWQARYRAPDGRERARNFTRKVVAEAFLATVESDKLRGQWTDPRLTRITFGEWNTRVQAGRVNLAASTRESDGSVIRSLILPTFEHFALSAIEPGHVRAWIAELVAAGYSPSTIRRAYTLLQLALELAVEDGRLARSPCRRIALPRIEQSEKRFLSIEEVEHLAGAIRPRYRAMVLTGAYTGLRPGELAALRIDRLDLLRRQLRVEEPLKTPAARRTLSFPSFLADELAAHLAAHSGDDGLVFTAPEGGRLRLGLFRRRIWYPAVRDSVGEPMRPHDLRHTHVALLIAAGEDPYVISQRLGHASIRTTYGVYGHLFEGRDRDAADALEAARTRSLADSPRTLGGSSVVSLDPRDAETPVSAGVSGGGAEGI
ncbi:MAG TPA: tyrosine-type recombinase/integrase [Acidimicrobiia bacterium]